MGALSPKIPPRGLHSPLTVDSSPDKQTVTSISSPKDNNNKYDAVTTLRMPRETSQSQSKFASFRKAGRSPPGKKADEDLGAQSPCLERQAESGGPGGPEDEGNQAARIIKSYQEKIRPATNERGQRQRQTPQDQVPSASSCTTDQLMAEQKPQPPLLQLR